MRPTPGPVLSIIDVGAPKPLAEKQILQPAELSRISVAQPSCFFSCYDGLEQLLIFTFFPVSMSFVKNRPKVSFRFFPYKLYAFLTVWRLLK